MDFIKAKGKELYTGDVRVLLRGFGLGGWLLPEGYMWKLYNKCDRPRRMEVMIETLCGKSFANTFWQRYLDSYITEKDIKFIAEEGFNSVRLPLNARHLYEIKEGKLVLIPEMLSRIDLLIDWCKRYHVYVILDMHGAPGGQTGQNIDDSEMDQPDLFKEKEYEEELIFLWRELAKRYSTETIVAGYDLLNEPLPNFFSQYNDKVLPLYRRLIREIREVDKNHLIILEGVHWATDFSIFDPFTKEEASDNIMLQFHKYWSNPDVESIQEFINWADKLNVPLFMGEGGENNCDWYTTAFPLYEQLNISWSFWSYKKMNCTNSPITFDVPLDWELLIQWIDVKTQLDKERAIQIFERFLTCIQNYRVNETVLRSLKREAPVKIPCEAYNEYHIVSKRIQGAMLRMNDPVSLIFENGNIGEVDYRKLGGDEQSPQDNVMVQLFAGDSVGYYFFSRTKEVCIEVKADGQGVLRVSIEKEEKLITVNGKADYQIELGSTTEQRQTIILSCISGDVKLDNIYLS